MSKECVLRIKTITDSTETEIVRMGKVLQGKGLALSYQEEGAEVQILLSEGQAELFRKGDYTLKLSLVQGKKTLGSLGIGNNEGEVGIYTHEVFYATTQGMTLVKLQYDLFFGKEKQEMKLRIMIK